MLDRNVLIVDDEKETEISIDAYNDIFQVLQKELELNYNINFHWVKSLEEGKKILLEKNIVFDVLLIDYDFPNDILPQKGVHLVKTIRESINKRCKIVFYTMHAPHELNSIEFIELINNDVFRFVPKDGGVLSLNYRDTEFNKSDQLIVEAIIDAIKDENPISLALENFLIDYKDLINDLNLEIDGKNYSIETVLETIRLYQDPGNKFVQNLLEMTFIDYINMK